MDKDAIAINNLTIVIPTYNRVDYLKQILDLIPEKINVVIGDNGAFVPETFKAQYPDFIFEVREQVIEALPNWNQCIKSVKTEFFMIPSDDDLIYTASFPIIKKYLDRYPKVDIMAFGYDLIDGEGKNIGGWLPDMLKEYTAPFGFEVFKHGVEARFPGLIFRTQAVKDVGYIDESFIHTAADSKLIQQISLRGDCVFIPEVIGAYRTWPESSTTIKIATDVWTAEILKWQNDILPEISEQYQKAGKNIDVEKIKDEVIARNLLAGVSATRRVNGIKAAFNYLSKTQFPHKASLTTKLRLLKSIFI